MLHQDPAKHADSLSLAPEHQIQDLERLHPLEQQLPQLGARSCSVGSAALVSDPQAFGLWMALDM